MNRRKAENKSGEVMNSNFHRYPSIAPNKCDRYDSQHDFYHYKAAFLVYIFVLVSIICYIYI